MDLNDIQAFANPVRSVACPPAYDAAKGNHSRKAVADMPLIQRMCAETAGNHPECEDLCGKLQAAKTPEEVVKICDEVAAWTEIPGEKPVEEKAEKAAVHPHGHAHATAGHKGK